MCVNGNGYGTGCELGKALGYALLILAIAWFYIRGVFLFRYVFDITRLTQPTETDSAVPLYKMATA